MRYHLLNTNLAGGPRYPAYMLDHARAAAFYPSWQHKVRSRIRPGDTVFLYTSGQGIVAWGLASGPARDKAIDPEFNEAPGELETYVDLHPFRRLEVPVTAREAQAAMGRGMMLGQTLVSIPEEGGRLLVAFLAGKRVE